MRLYTILTVHCHVQFLDFCDDSDGMNLFMWQVLSCIEVGFEAVDTVPSATEIEAARERGEKKNVSFITVLPWLFDKLEEIFRKKQPLVEWPSGLQRQNKRTIQRLIFGVTGLISELN